MSTPQDRGHLDTEQRDPRVAKLHQASVQECLGLLDQHHEEAKAAFTFAMPKIQGLIEAAEPGFRAGGRLIYLGAGTSGRLGVLDASEAPPTFCVTSQRVIGIIAGGEGALRKSSEGKEADHDGAIAELEALTLNPGDTVIGIAAGGTTPYVDGALKYAHGLGEARPITGMISCCDIRTQSYMDHLIYLPTGPELITGSTRMKAGTATKLALNAISTTLMICVGRVYQNLMVDVRATNEKLKDRAIRILCELTPLTRDDAHHLLKQAGGYTKVALVMHHRQCDAENAKHILDEHEQRLDLIL